MTMTMMRSFIVILSAVFALSLSTRAGTLGLDLPTLSSHRLSLAGDVNSDQGIAGMQSQLSPGHVVNSLYAAPGDKAYRFLIGHEQAGYDNEAVWSVDHYIPGAAHANASTESAVGTGSAGMVNTATFFAGAHAYSEVQLVFGYTGGNVETNTWNLDDDQLNTDYYTDPSDSLEERIYEANSNLVFASLQLNGTTIMSFDYSPFYMTLEYSTNPDEIAAYSDPVDFSIADGLVGDELDLANALSADLTAAGGQAQLYMDSIQAASRTDYIDSTGQNVYGIFSFSGHIMGVPEPSSITLLSVVGLFLLFGRRLRM